MSDTVYLEFLACHKLRKCGKYVAFLVSHFLRFLKCPTENETGYNSCVFNILLFERGHENSENYRIYGI